MATTPTMSIRPDDEALEWAGAIEVRHAPSWSQAWRLPYSSINLYPEDMLSRAAMSAGVRIRFRTDSPFIAGRAQTTDEWAEASPVDVVVDGDLRTSIAIGADGVFAYDGMPDRLGDVELWLPQFGSFRLEALDIAADSKLLPAKPSAQRRLVTYGSSITQCRHADSPTRTWPARVSRSLELDLTCLGFGGECHLDPMVARLIRDLAPDVVTLCLGINVYGRGSFNRRSLRPAVIGFVSTIRDRGPDFPICVISPIVSPDREDVAGPSGMSLADIRAEVASAVRGLQVAGDRNLHLIDGLDILGPDNAHLLPDGVHPNDAGYATMATRISRRVGRLIEPLPNAAATIDGAAVTVDATG